jgi:hypothetical protein
MTNENQESQDKAEYAMASAVARFVEFHDVRLGEVSAKLAGTRDSLIASAPWEIRIKRVMSARFDDARKIVTVVADLAVDVVAQDPKVPDALSCTCVYYLDYVFNVNGGPTGEELQEHLAAFAKVNGIYNVWPYFRELVQSMGSRLGLPPVVLPVFRVPRPSRSIAPPALSAELTLTKPGVRTAVKSLKSKVAKGATAKK